MKGFLYQTTTNDPYYNLALEAYLAEICRNTNACCLYLWQNRDCVVIGRHQNLYTECNIQFAKDHNISIARRTTGGGAVYQDLGNLNFTLITTKTIFDKNESTELIASALRDINIDAQVNGRNDICINNLKISGNAFSSDSKIGLHHGTLLYEVNPDIMASVLNVSQNKLKKRGVDSVKQRVTSIRSLYPDISLNDIKETLVTTFKNKFDVTTSDITINLEDKIFKKLLEQFTSPDWIFGKYSDYTVKNSKQFIWGSVTILAEMKEETILSLAIETDALEAELIYTLFQDLNTALKKEVPITSIFETYKLKYPNEINLIDDIQRLTEELIIC